MSGRAERILSPFDNPVFRRELKLVTRRGRFEWVLFLLTVAVTLVIASVGGRTGATIHPAYVGKVLYQTFFGIAHGLVLVAGPAVAANSIASEREGRTYEALALTGLAPARIAVGKFLAAFTHVGAYVVAMAPVGALPFLFGGVSALSVVYAFAMLFVFTALATLLGLAISARLPSTRSALITSIAGGLAVAIALYLVVGDALGTAICEEVGMQRPGTIWLPVVLAEASMEPLQRSVLVGAPLVIALVIGWFLFEVCTANLADASADRTTGMKRWYAVTSVLAAGLCAGAISVAEGRADRAGVAIDCITGYTVFALFAAFVFQGDAIQAPRRIRLLWKSERAGLLRRFLGPGVTSSAALQLGATAIALGIIASTGMLLSLSEEYGPTSAPLGVVALAIPAAMFILFVAGLSLWLRVHWGPTASRVVLAVVLIVLFAAPYAVTSILGGQSADPDSIVPLLAAPSPLADVDLARNIANEQSDPRMLTLAIAITAGYALLGLVFLIAGAVRADRIVTAADADAARMDALIAKEDAAVATSGAV